MNILDFAQRLPDHRQEVKVRHLSTDIIFITVAAVICGAEDWKDIVNNKFIFFCDALRDVSCNYRL